MWLSTSQRWILALGAPLIEQNALSHEWIGGAPILRESKRKGCTALGDGWGIHSREGLLSDLKELEEPCQHRAWNLGRWVAIAGWGVREGYLEEGEFWELARPIARKTQGLFSSFVEYGEDYTRGRTDWNGGKDPDFEYRIRMLNVAPHSPWVRLPWDMALDAPGAQIAELPFGSHERALRAGRVLVDPRRMIARTERERFALALVAIDARALNLETHRLGTSPVWHPSSIGSRGSLLAPPPTYRTTLLEWYGGKLDEDLEQLEGIVERARSSGKPAAEFTSDPLQARAAEFWLAEGRERLLHHRWLYRAIWTARFAGRGYRGGALSIEEAWDMLLSLARELQPKFRSWTELFDAFETSQYLLEGWRPSLQYDREMLLDDPLGVFVETPWDTNLESEVPLPVLPGAILVATLSTYFECPFCLSSSFMPRPGQPLKCGACGWTSRISLHDLKHLIWPELHLLRQRAEEVPRRHRTYGGQVEFYTRIGIGDWSCRCGRPLPTVETLRAQALRAGDEGAVDSCPDCGASRHCWADTRLLGLLEPLASLMMYVVPALPAPEMTSARIACSACGASMTVHGETRLVSCSSCSSVLRLDDDLWFRLHPPSGAPELVFVLPRGPDWRWPFKPAVDTHSETYSSATNTAQQQLVTAYDTQFLCHLPPNAPLSREARAASTLGALELGRLGGDPGRLAGFPRTAEFQYRAFTELKAESLGDRDSLRTEVEAALTNGEPAVLALRAAARARHIRHGFMLDWFTEDEALAHLGAVFRRVRPQYDDWGAFARAHLDAADESSKVELAAALESLLSLPHPPSFEPAEEPESELDLVSVEVTTRCHGCLAEVSLHGFPDTGCCPRCRTELLPSEPSLTKLLEPIVFSARLRGLGEVRETRDYRSSGVVTIRSRHGAPHCGGCQRPLSSPELLATFAEGRRHFECPTCRAPSELRPADDILRSVDPSATFLILPAVQPPRVPKVTCVSCGGPLEVAGQGRVVRCGFCGAHSCLSDSAYKQIHPVARRQAMGIAVARLQPFIRRLEALLFNGVPPLWT